MLIYLASGSVRDAFPIIIPHTNGGIWWAKSSLQPAGCFSMLCGVRDYPRPGQRVSLWWESQTMTCYFNEQRVAGQVGASSQTHSVFVQVEVSGNRSLGTLTSSRA